MARIASGPAHRTTPIQPQERARGWYGQDAPAAAHRLFVLALVLSGIGIVTRRAGGDEPDPFQVRHQVLAQLGGEHIGHAIYRRSAGGARIVAWGDRVLEWPLDGSKAATEVVAATPGMGYSNGGCAVDLDGDGSDEVVVARGEGRWGRNPELVWFQEQPGRDTWVEHRVEALPGKPNDSPHDIAPFSLKLPSGKQLRGMVVLISRRQLVWYEIPAALTEPWRRHEIATFPGTEEHSGMAIGDVAGRGRPDIVCGMFWAECPADPTRDPWTLHRYGSWTDGGWGGMAKHGLADLDGDGRLDIVACEAEIPNARLGVFHHAGQSGDRTWEYDEIERGLYCPHSLVVTDLDGDGRPDIIVGEMTAGGWDFPLRTEPKIFAYRNEGNRHFRKSTLVSGWGVHEMGIVPRHAAGTTIIFAADEIQPQKFPDMKTHVSTWRITARVGGR